VPVLLTPLEVFMLASAEPVTSRSSGVRLEDLVAVPVIDGATQITPGGVWSRTQPCLASEPCTGPVVGGVRTNVVRAPDGVHFCPTGRPSVRGRTFPCSTSASGARRYATAILEPLLASAGVSRA
jgi:hypothetical protein